MPATRPPTPPSTKLTARMHQLRALIAQGKYPDLDELARRIVEALGRVSG